MKVLKKSFSDGGANAPPCPPLATPLVLWSLLQLFCVLVLIEPKKVMNYQDSGMLQVQFWKLLDLPFLTISGNRKFPLLATFKLSLLNSFQAG